ncbi:hypothetical protein Tco_1069628 [Tanacetum coccineum]|uniref:Integrase catalytic domain-containing protein n=1 Tax=Tanacetum coccineum TaxID=301880 RepID=A0ABQ5HKJ5_9ASTR
MQSGRIKVIKNPLVPLSGIRRANYVYSMDSQAVTRKIMKARRQLGEFHIRHLGVGELHQQNGLVEGMNLTLLAKFKSSVIGFKTTIDMLGFFVGLLLLNKGILVVVKVKCIFMGYRKGIVGIKCWRYEFSAAGSYEVQTNDLMDYHSACDREQHSTLELFRYREDNNEVAFVVAELEKIYAHDSSPSLIAESNISELEKESGENSLPVTMQIVSFKHSMARA